jgi:glycosyltransferase involved in cell wall biosynthesis
VGGIERFVQVLAGALAGRGHRVTVVCCRFGGAPGEEELEGFRVRRIPSSYVLEGRAGVPFPLPSPPALLRVLGDAIGAADVVHVQDGIYATSAAALALARRRGVPSVLTQHVGFVPQSSPALDAVEHAAHATIGRSARLATLVAALNPAVSQWAAARWGLADVRVLPVGVPAPPAAAGDRATVRRSFGLPPERFVALFVGRDVVKKGLDVFLAAADPAYELVAVTDRPGSASGATLLPFMSHERLQELLSCVDAFVLPSEAEGFPVALQEALAAGLPVVTTRQAGYERYLEPDDVLYVERDPQAVRAAIARLVESEELRQRLSAQARAAAEREFGVERFVSAYEELYREAIETRRGRA